MDQDLKLSDGHDPDIMRRAQEPETKADEECEGSRALSGYGLSGMRDRTVIGDGT